MKLALISNLYPPYHRGGAEKIVQLLAQGLQTAGHEVVIISTQPQKGLSRTEENDQVVYRLQSSHIYYLLNDYKQNFFKKLIWHWQDIFQSQISHKILKILKNEQVEVVLTHNLKGLAFTLPRLIQQAGFKHIHTLHDYQLIDPHGSMYRTGGKQVFNSIFYKFYRLMAKRHFGRPDLVISPSKFLLNKHAEYGFFKGSEKQAWLNPVIVDDYAFSKKNESEILQLLFVGQLVEHKGILFLIKALKNSDFDNYTLTIAGDGPCQKKVEALINKDNKFKYVGRINQNELKDLFQLNDFLIVPSLWQENSPTVVYEAYLNKTPVIVSDKGGMPELVQSGRTGYVYSADNSIELIDLLKKINQKKPDAQALGQAGFDFIKQAELTEYIKRLEGYLQ